MDITVADETVLVPAVGYALLVVTGVRVGMLALRSRRRSARPQAALWSYFAIVGATAVSAGVIGAIETVVNQPPGVTPSLMLAVALAIALTMREAYYNTVLSGDSRERLGEFRLRHGYELVCIGVIFVGSIATLYTETAVLALVTGVTALSVIGYGMYFQQRRTGQSATRGTFIDGLLRHALPGLVFGGGVAVTPLLGELPEGQLILTTVESVFVILTAGALLTVSIKLNQHLLTQS